jgi:hypothetical protein
VTPGLFNDQAIRILGQGFFDHDNKENRWRALLASDSALTVEFRDEFERAKAINLELRSRLVLAAGEVLPVSIFDGPIEGFGADNEKLYKLITEKRDELRSRDLSQRAASLPITDPRRMAFFANSKDSFLKSLSPPQLARPQCQLYEHTMEYSKCAAFRCPNSGTEGSRWHAPSVVLA